MRQEYVAGFLHDDDLVAMVEKNRPEWQAGLLNGIGGKIEQSDLLPVSAMTREFEEETGVYISEREWQHFLTLEGTQSRVYCYAAFDTGGWLSKVRTVEDEEIRLIPFEFLDEYYTVPNVKWIVPLMLQRENYRPITVNFHDGTRGSK